MARNKKNRKGARRQQQKMGKDFVYSKLTLLLVFFKSVFVTSLLVAALIYGVRAYQGLHQSDSKPFTQFELIGEFQYLNKHLFRERIKSSLQGGYFTLDLAALKISLEQDPWVHRVDLRRAWPDTLSVRVEEQQPIAFWGEGAYLNRYGEQFPLSGDRISRSMPFLHGTDGREKSLIESYMEYEKLLKQVGLNLRQLSEDARHDQRLLLEDGTIIALGRERQLDRVARFARVYPDVLNDVAASVAALDLRYNHGFSVEWKDLPETQAKNNNIDEDSADG